MYIYKRNKNVYIILYAEYFVKIFYNVNTIIYYYYYVIYLIKNYTSKNKIQDADKNDKKRTGISFI